MFDVKLKYYNTIATIEYSDKYIDNYSLFEKGIDILKNRLNENDFSEFNESERDTLEKIFEIII